MIYIIGGPPRCGKTTLARKLSNQLNISYIPADYLMSVISPYIHETEMKERLPRWYARVKTDKSNDLLYTQYSARDLVGFYNTEAETYWLGIKNFILYALHDDQDFIIEGGQLKPALVRALINEEGDGRFNVAFLYKTGEEIVAGLKAHTDPKDWTRNETSEETYHKIAAMIATFSELVKQECIKYNLPAYDMSKAFHAHIEQLVDCLASGGERNN